MREKQRSQSEAASFGFWCLFLRFCFFRAWGHKFLIRIALITTKLSTATQQNIKTNKTKQQKQQQQQRQRAAGSERIAQRPY